MPGTGGVDGVPSPHSIPALPVPGHSVDPGSSVGLAVRRPYRAGADTRNELPALSLVRATAFWLRVAFRSEPLNSGRRAAWRFSKPGAHVTAPQLSSGIRYQNR